MKLDMRRSIEESRRIAIEREIQLLEKKEARLLAKAEKPKPPGWKQELEKKIPDKVYNGLEKAFCKAFEIIFEKGTGIIEKSCNKDDIEKERMIQEYAFQIKAGRKELKKPEKSAAASSMKNMAFTTVEGIGLGILGIGLPDIVIFTGMILKGVYETALHYGFPYDIPEERLLILRMLETAMLNGEERKQAEKELDRAIVGGAVFIPAEGDMERQIQRTASVFAVDTLLLKFIQGLPIAGIIGGAANPVYYHKIMRYVQLKYKKRYLYQLKDESRP